MLVPMAKVEILGPKNTFHEVLCLIHEQGRLHIEDLTRKIQKGELPLDRMEVVKSQQDDRDRMEDLLLRVRAILKALDQAGGGVDGSEVGSEYGQMFDLTSDELAERVSEVIGEVEDNAADLAAQRTSLESEIALLSRYEPILRKIQPLARQVVTTGAYDSVALLFERRYKSALDALREEFNRITHSQCEIVSVDVDEDTTAAIVVFGRQYAEPVHKFLAMENVNQVKLPTEFDGMPLDAAYDEIGRRQQELPDELRKVQAQLEKLSAKWAVKLTAIRNVLVDRAAEIETIPKFGRTEYTFVITGWMPVSDIPALTAALSRQWGDSVIIQQTEISEEDYADTPVALKNSPMIQPFQALLGVYGTPRYGTIDPTWMLFIFYPLFFGMIVGDVGYGLIMLGVIVWLRLKFKENNIVQVATSILGPAATMVVAFGVLYGEMFGNVPAKLGWVSGHDPAEWFGVVPTFHRVAAVQYFMYIAIAVGVVHVLFGLVIGVVNAVRTRHRKHLYEKAGILTFLLAAMVAVGFAVVVKEGSTVYQAIFALIALGGFFFAMRGGGIMGVIETIETVSNMASYIRIMAVGLAGAIFADAINDIVADSGNLVAAALIAVLLHGLNFVIAAFSPTIHALRLNFLEFFGKFYETGKQQYSPFTKTGGEKST